MKRSGDEILFKKGVFLRLGEVGIC